MSPIVIQRYYDTRKNRFVSPGLSMVRCTNFGTLPINSLVAIQVQACIGKNFDLDDSGNVPADHQDTTFFVGFTGIPIFAVKTRTDWQSGADSFAASITGGYYTPLTSLANGRAAVCGVITTDTTPSQDYMAQLQLLDASNNPCAIPSSPMPIDIPNPITLGTEADAPSGARYSGVATIDEGNSYVDVTVAGLTTDGVVAALTQQDTGDGLTSFWATIPVAGTLRINSGSPASSATWKCYWQLESL